MTTARQIYTAHPTQAEIDDVLEQRLSAALGTLNEDGSIHLTSLMVEAEGTARLIERPEADTVNHRIRKKYVVPDAMDALDAAWSRFDDVSMEVTPARWRSWTGTVLAETTEASLGRSYEGIWRPD